MSDRAQDDLEKLSLPLYNFGEVARILHLDPDKVRRWLKGYRYRRDGTFVEVEPVVQGQEAEEGASFLNLIELRFFKRFLEIGIPPRRLRKLYKRASELLGVANPFIRNAYYSLNSELFVKLLSEDGQSSLVSLDQLGQLGIPEIIEQFGKEIWFSKETGIALRWYPMEQGHDVVLDPRRSFGIPIVDSAGIKTEVIYDLFRAENRNVAVVCDWFGISNAQVLDAVRFEESLIAA